MFKICDKKEFIANEEYDAIFCFGAGRWSRFVGQVFGSTAVMKRIVGFVDNDVSKEGTTLWIDGHEYKIYTPAIFEKYSGGKVAVIVTCARLMEVLEQLKHDPNLYEADFYYIHHFELAEIETRAMNKQVPENLHLSEKPQIPKVIHYCWFGGNPIPDKYKEWMESWKKYCPDYEIKEWNETNYDITKNKYMYQAYQQKKWGFVPDYARLDIIYNHGGIYLDTDVEIVSNFDELLYQKGFAGFETEQFVALGLGFGAVPGLPIIKQMMDYYEDKDFINEDGTLNLIASPRLQTEVLLEHGLEQNGEYQVVDDLTIFPEKMFCGKSERLRRIRLTPYTRSIHHYDGSWMDGEEKKLYDEKEAVFKEYEIKKIESENTRNIKVSAVIIVYNVEDYLKECVDSIRNQTYQNLEIILVDDGSTDNSGALCDAYSKEDDRIKVVHKKNEGLVSARQAGIEVATGDYVIFVDGDDWIDLNMYEVLARMAVTYKTDIVLSGIMRNFPDRIQKESNLIGNGYYDKKDMEEKVYPRMMFSMRIMNHYVDPSLCNKLFRREVIKKVLLEEDKEIFFLGEDAAATYPCLLEANSIFVSDRAFYHHRIVPVAGNAMPSYKNEHVYERLEKFYLYLKKVFANSKYNRIMESQLTAYYMIKLNQATIRRIDVDFLQFFRNSIQFMALNGEVRYELPMNKIPENCKLVLYGAGAVGKDYDVQLRANNYEMVAWVDKNAEQLRAEGWPIKGLEELKELEYDKIILATKKEALYSSMKNMLLDLGVPEEKILWLPPVERM